MARAQRVPINGDYPRIFRPTLTARHGSPWWVKRQDRLRLARPRTDVFRIHERALPDPRDAPLAERPDRPVFYFNPNSSTKNVGHFLRIDIVAQVPSPSLAWRR